MNEHYVEKGTAWVNIFTNENDEIQAVLGYDTLIKGPTYATDEYDHSHQDIYVVHEVFKHYKDIKVKEQLEPFLVKWKGVAALLGLQCVVSSEVSAFLEGKEIRPNSKKYKLKK